MNEVHEASLAVAVLLDDFGRFGHDRLSPCTTLALGNLAMVAGHGDDLLICEARRRAGERRKSALERAFEMASVV